MEMLDDAMSEVGSDAEATVEKAKQACMCSCLGFLAFPCMLVGIYFNEKNLVCTQNAIGAYGDVVKTETCSNVTLKEGDAMYLNGCVPAPLDWGPANWALPSTMTAPKFKGVSASLQIEMYQCVETATTECEDKDCKKKKTKYSYSLEWSASYHGSSAFHKTTAAKDACGVTANPSEPAWLKTVGMGASASVRTGNDVKIGTGGYVLSENFIKQIPIDTPVTYDAATAKLFKGTTSDTSVHTLNMNDLALTGAAGAQWITTCPTTTKVGCIQMQFKTTNPAVVASVAGGVTTGNKLDTWQAPPTWVCEPQGTGRVWTKAMTAEDAVASMSDSADTMAQILRFVLWLGCWATMYCAFYPLYAIIDIAGDWLDNIPCIGDWLEDFIEGLAGAMLCVGTCCCGTAFALLAISISWVIVRPMVGIPLLIVSILLFAGILYYKTTLPPSKRKQKMAAGEDEGSQMELMEAGDNGSDDEKPE